jgi:hypothetical protein
MLHSLFQEELQAALPDAADGFDQNLQVVHTAAAAVAVVAANAAAPKSAAVLTALDLDHQGAARCVRSQQHGGLLAPAAAGASAAGSCCPVAAAEFAGHVKNHDHFLLAGAVDQALTAVAREPVCTKTQQMGTSAEARNPFGAGISLARKPGAPTPMCMFSRCPPLFTCFGFILLKSMGVVLSLCI